MPANTPTIQVILLKPDPNKLAITGEDRSGWR
jgi:hypothetical protein